MGPERRFGKSVKNKRKMRSGEAMEMSGISGGETDEKMDYPEAQPMKGIQLSENLNIRIPSVE